jgi:cell division septum initiation protein DivIVA
MDPNDVAATLKDIQTNIQSLRQENAQLRAELHQGNAKVNHSRM